jgi:hypothetical protein
MEGLATVRELLRPNDWQVKVDMREAYLHVPVQKVSQKYLQFRWQGVRWKFVCLPFGLQSAPRVFTKMMRPVLGLLREKGIRVVCYLDDILVLSRSRAGALKDLAIVLKTLQNLGFLLNEKKAVLVPTQKMEFLDEVECTKVEVENIPEGSKEVSQQIKASSLHYIKAVGGFSRQAKLDCPGHGRHRATYSGPAVGPRKGVEGSPPKSHDVEPKSVVTSSSISYGGPRVVGPKGTALERKIGVAKKLTGPCDFDRRKRHRLCGSPSTGSQTGYCDPGELDSKRSGHPIYKLKRARSYLSDGFGFGKTQKMEKQESSSLDRQYGVQMGGEQRHNQNARHVSHL